MSEDVRREGFTRPSTFEASNRLSFDSGIAEDDSVHSDSLHMVKTTIDFSDDEVMSDIEDLADFEFDM